MKEMLTKEECEKILEIAKSIDHEFYHCYTLEDLYKNKGHKNLIECFEQLINEHFDNEQKIEWLKKVMDKGVFELCFKDEKSVADWYERGMWHINKVNELSKELKQLKSSHDILVNYADEQLCLIKELTSNPPLKFEDLKENMWVWDKYYKQYIKLRIINNSLYYGNDEEYRFCDYIEFEENRFYLREVKE